MNKSKTSIKNSSPLYQTYTTTVIFKKRNLKVDHHSGEKWFIHQTPPEEPFAWHIPYKIFVRYISGLTISSHTANERRRYFVTTFLIGWVQARINPKKIPDKHLIFFSAFVMSLSIRLWKSSLMQYMETWATGRAVALLFWYLRKYLYFISSPNRKYDPLAIV